MYLERSTEDYQKNGTLMTTSKVKANILEKLAETIYTYSLSIKCTDKWCCCGTCQEIPLSQRTRLLLRLLWLATKHQIQDGKLSHQTQRLRCAWGDVQCTETQEPCGPEVCKEYKKALKGRGNYLPPYLTGEDEESQEQERIQLLTEVRKRDNNKLTKEKMAKTCAHKKQNHHPITQHRGHQSQMASSIWRISRDLQVHAN